MNLLSYKDVEVYLKNKQVYFKKEISDIDFKTIAASGKVHDIGDVELKRLNEQQISLTFNINGHEVTLYEHKSDLEMFAFVKVNFIPVDVLVQQFEYHQAYLKDIG